MGRCIARSGYTLLSGATTGLPYAAVLGAKEVGCLSIGFSPAQDKREQISDWHLPTDGFDLIIYEASGYFSRSVPMINSSDMVIMIGGRAGTLEEMSITLALNKPLGILLGTGGYTTVAKDIIDYSEYDTSKVMYHHDPEQLLAALENVL
jgi:uncharacterized protein (TIGR00725 family)